MVNRHILQTLIVSVCFLFSVSAKADKLCLKTTVNKKTFKVTTQSKVAAVCPAGYTAIADTSSFTGATGATGSQGPAGFVNLAGCRRVNNTCSHTFSGSCTASCLAGYEFVLQYVGNVSGCGATSLYDYPGIYTNGLGYSVTNFSAGDFGCSYTSNIYAICCPVS